MAQHRVPAIYPDRLFVMKGGLVSYGVDRTDLYRRAATYMGRIQEQLTNYDLVINLNAAKALGL
jgi:putative tryptophan/tyrosine transport system substrate-binding protein